MKLNGWPLWLLLFPLPLLALACGSDGNDADNVRNTIREVAAGFNDQDADKLSQLLTANFFGVEPTPEALEDYLDPFFKIENLEIVSVTVDGGKATVETTRTEGGKTVPETMFLVKVDGRWRLDSVELVSDEGLQEEPGEAAPAPVGPEEELLASLVLTDEEVGEALASLAPIQQTSQGPVSNEDEIERAIDPEETRAAIETYGRITGYEASYRPQEGEEEILIVLELYETPEGASGLLKDVLEDPETFGGLDQFDVGDIGDEAEGRTGEPIPGVPATGVLLRVERVGAIVSVALSEDDIRDEVRQLAEKVAERIGASLEG